MYIILLYFLPYLHSYDDMAICNFAYIVVAAYVAKSDARPCMRK